MTAVPGDLADALRALEMRRLHSGTLMGQRMFDAIADVEAGNFRKVAARHHVDAEAVLSASNRVAALERECAKPLLRRLAERAS